MEVEKERNCWIHQRAPRVSQFHEQTPQRVTSLSVEIHPQRPETCRILQDTRGIVRVHGSQCHREHHAPRLQPINPPSHYGACKVTRILGQQFRRPHLGNRSIRGNDDAAETVLESNLDGTA